MPTGMSTPSAYRRRFLPRIHPTHTCSQQHRLPEQLIIPRSCSGLRAISARFAKCICGPPKTCSSSRVTSAFRSSRHQSAASVTESNYNVLQELGMAARPAQRFGPPAGLSLRSSLTHRTKGLLGSRRHIHEYCQIPSQNRLCPYRNTQSNRVGSENTLGSQRTWVTFDSQVMPSETRRCHVLLDACRPDCGLCRLMPQMRSVECPL